MLVCLMSYLSNELTLLLPVSRLEGASNPDSKDLQKMTLLMESQQLLDLKKLMPLEHSLLSL